MNKLDLDRQYAEHSEQSGMTLIETTVALVIIMIALLGVVHSFTYAVSYNFGNAIRTESLAILQEEVENMRALKWTSSGTHPDIVGTGNSCTPVRKLVDSNNGGSFVVEKIIDDDVSTPTTCEVDASTQLKDITVTVRIATDDNPAWWFAVPNTVVLRRTRGN